MLAAGASADDRWEAVKSGPFEVYTTGSDKIAREKLMYLEQFREALRVITGKHVQIDEVNSGTSVMSQNDLRLHFGLGGVETVDLIEVKWPTTEKLEKFTQVKANQIITIREGNGIVATFKPPATQ